MDDDQDRRWQRTSSELRRRRSLHRTDDDEAEVNDGDVGDELHELAGDMAATSRATGRDLDDAALEPVPDQPESARPRPSLAAGVTTPRVRFSQDLERTATPEPMPTNPSSRPRSEASLVASRGPSTVDRPQSPPLSVRTTPVMALPGSGSHTRTSNLSTSPSSLQSPWSPPSARSLPSTKVSSPSGVSPTTRNRGYSLRRALLTRSVQDHVDPHERIDEPLQLNEPNPPRELHTDKAWWSSNGSPSPSSAGPRPVRHGSGALPNYEIWFRKRSGRIPIMEAASTIYDRARRAILRIQVVPPTKDGRQIPLDDAIHCRPMIDERTGRAYVTNVIRSSRYTIWTFLPRQLFAQLSKLANFYFLCVSILQMIPSLSTTGTYTTIIPLLVFVSLSMAKEGYDDLRRYRLDKVENNRLTHVLRVASPTSSVSASKTPASTSAPPLRWEQKRWQDVQVGEVVRLRRDEAAPADLVVLHADSPNDVAYIETMALDGETNLKSKQPCPPLARQCREGGAGLTTCHARFVVEDPNLDLYNFEGRVTVADETMPLTNNEVIYRGSILRNVDSALGMVIYTGEECKIRMNASKNPRIKAPSMQARVNRIVVITVIFVIVLAIFNTCAYRIWSQRTENKSWYLTNARVSFFPIFASFIIMFNTLIPLSLYVSLEIIKLAQMFLMNDIDMYDPVSDTPMESRTSTINEELGQVSYIFSDKTGTLTDNCMRLRKLSVAGIAWLHDPDLQAEAADGVGVGLLRHKKRQERRSGMGKQRVARSISLARHSNVSESPSLAEPRRSNASRSELHRSQWRSSARPTRHQPRLQTEALLRYLCLRPRTQFALKARFFLLSIALCHTCLPELQGDGKVEYQAISPDEVALVRAAQELDYMVIDRDSQTITLKTFPSGPDGEPTVDVYEILDVIEFSSARKRMSIVVRFPNRQICVICKGADSALMPLLRLSTLATEKAIEVERKANVRKSMEAQEVIRRTSEQMSRKASLNRPSMSANRTSIGGIGRASLGANRLRPIVDEVDHWLSSREHDVEMASLDDESVYYTPRPSAHFSPGRPSMGSEGRDSIRIDLTDELLDDSHLLDDGLVFERCFQHINDFATEGLRTLLHAFRYLSEREYSNWKKVYADASTSLVDRPMLMEQAAQLIEQGLELAGVTAVEDRLQKGVPEAIDKLRRAKIKLWMLTGDKRETAINIGHSCRLIKDYSTVTVLDHAIGDVEQHMAATMVAVNRGNVAHSVVVIDGSTLTRVEASETSFALLLNLAVLVDSVICCRASPSQKASLVKAIRCKVKDSVTLAIGDGANDIAMIQEAHVGIGITGKEGFQAARTSDYSIAQFRFLLKLLLVHGRWNYIRTCKYTLATFWKEALFYLTQALYQRWAGYTGTSLYESWSLSMFNTLFTSLPVIFLGIFEKDLAASTLLAVPELYSKGQRSAGFNLKIYLGWIFMAASESMIIYFVMLGLYGQCLFTTDNGLYSMGVMTFSACVTFISTKLQVIEMHNKSIMAVISFILSVGGWFMWNILLSLIYPVNAIYDVKGRFLHRFGQNALWWLVLILIILSCVIFEIAVSSLRSAWFPTDVDIFREYEQDLPSRKRFEEAASTELQQGWLQGTHPHRHDDDDVNGDDDVDHVDSGGKRGRRRLSFESKREKEIQALLDRPRIMPSSVGPFPAGDSGGTSGGGGDGDGAYPYSRERCLNHEL